MAGETMIQMTPEQLSLAVAKVVQEEAKKPNPDVQALRDDMKRVERAALFPHGDGDTLLETCGKSVIDTSVFSKDYRDRPSGVMDGAMVARRMSAGRSGPWLSLSPTMQKFAEVLRCRGDVGKLRAKGIDVHDYNKEVLDQIAKASGPLTTTDVGALVPIEFLATVIEFATATSAILPKLWRIPMGSLSLRIPRIAQTAGSYYGGIILYHPDEAGEKFETKPNFDTLTFTAKKLIGMMILTDELIADSAINIVNYATSLFVRAFRWETEHEVIQGSGAGNQMLGIMVDPGINTVLRQTLGVVQYEDVVALDSALDENFDDLTYITRKATANELRLQKDTVGQPVYKDGLNTFIGAAMPPTILGEPVIKTRNAKPMGSTGDVILGDLGFYIWAVRQDMTIDQSKERYFEFDETAVRFVVRQDGAPGVPIAFAVLEDGTS